MLGGNGDAEVTCVEDDGVVTFEMQISQAGRERDISLGVDGTLLSIEMTLAETPAAVQRAITIQVGAGALVGVDKISDAGAISYDVVMTTKDGQERAFTVEADGTISSLEVAFAETPPAVQRAITAQVGAGRLRGITRIFDESLQFFLRF